MDVELLNQIRLPEDEPLTAYEIARQSPYLDENDQHTLWVIRMAVESLNTRCGVIFMSRPAWESYWKVLTHHVRTIFHTAVGER